LRPARCLEYAELRLELRGMPPEGVECVSYCVGIDAVA
jgi:hypothetical protein